MRDKKVRAWNKVTEVYLYSDKFPSMWQFYKELDNRGIVYSPTEDYTGLKDKNGKEEYHKDILDGGGLGHLVIEYGFYDNDEHYEDNQSGFGWYLRSLKDGDVYGIAYIDLYKCPVIGNIYENKELV